MKFERGLISETLAEVNGKVTHAAKLLGVGYQRLAYIIGTKHPDLLKKRTAVRRPHEKLTSDRVDFYNHKRHTIAEGYTCF